MGDLLLEKSLQNSVVEAVFLFEYKSQDLH